MKETRSVFIIVRETPTVKEKLWALAKTNGFSELSVFISREWRKWLQ